MSHLPGGKQGFVIKGTDNDAQALYFEGNRAWSAGELGRAEECYRAAIAGAPQLAEAHANLAFVLDLRNAIEDADASYRRAIDIDPRQALVQRNYGAFLAKHKRFDAAEKAARESIRLDPNSAAAWSNLGVLLACVKREVEAEQCQRQAIALDPLDRIAPFNLSYLLLRQARFSEGWACLDARKSHQPLLPEPACPRWQGEPLAGKRLLIEFEAGHGDMIQFCRYASVLKAQGARTVALTCHPALKTLFASLDGCDEIYAIDEHVPTDCWDFWTPMLSVPYRCGTNLSSLPARIPYLAPAPDRVARWSSVLRDQGMRVGLVWKGNANFENDADRSLAGLRELAPLWSIPGITFVSLQKGPGQEEASYPPVGMPIVDLASSLHDFHDTAAVARQLDLVISVDTAVAHLAGAIGTPCWILLPDYKTDWRWMKDREDTPWYPGVVRLFRQERMGDWAGTILRVQRELRQLQAAGLAPTGRD